MEYEFTGTLENFTHSMEELSATFTVTAEQFNTSFREAFGFDDTNWKEEVNKASIRVIENTQDEPQARLTPAICSCCGGRIGKDNYCEFCGTRYW